MSDFVGAIDGLARWFAEQGISTDRLTVIFNFADRYAAVKFDASVQRDFRGLAQSSAHLDLLHLVSWQSPVRSRAPFMTRET